MKVKQAKDKNYKGYDYCYSKRCECWKVYHSGYPLNGRRSWFLMDYTSEKKAKEFISKKVKINKGEL